MRAVGSKLRTGFTLIELLVVFSIIGILTALLMPALVKGRENGRQIICLSNVSQLQLGWTMYCDDQNGILPLNAKEMSSDSLNASTTDSLVVGDARVSADLALIKQGSIYRYPSSPAIYHCPSDYSTIAASNALRTRSYSMDYYLHGRLDPRYVQAQPSSSAGDPPMRLSEASSPATTFVFLDENERTIDDGVFLLHWDPDLT